MKYTIKPTEQFRGIHGARKKTWYICSLRTTAQVDTTQYLTRRGEWVNTLTKECVFPTKGLAEDFLHLFEDIEFHKAEASANERWAYR